jgi:DHA2 family multidrug resistance protein-like MFS transporter
MARPARSSPPELAMTTWETALRPEKATYREWIGLAIIALPCIVYAMDLTVLNLAVPSLSADLQPSAAQLLWIVDIYGFLAAGSLLIMGTLGDRIGRRKLLLIGSACFASLSVIAAFSRTPGMLIAARALLGVAGATMTPSTLSLISNMFRDAQEKTFAVSVWVASFSLGGVIGPAIGGMILARFWWGAVFLAPVPVMALLLIAGPLLLPEHKNAHAGRLDLVSAILSVVSVLPIIYGIKLVAEGGSPFPASLAAIVGIAFGAWFLRRQRTLSDPLLDLRLFRRSAVAVALAIYTFDFFVGFGILIIVAQYLQLVLQLTPFQAGLWSTPVGLGFVVGSLLTSPALKLMRSVYVLGCGLALGATGLAIMALAVQAHGLILIVLGNVVFSIGTAPCTAIIADLVVSAAPQAQSGAASALSELASELGGALGIALLGSLVTVVYRSALSASVPSALHGESLQRALRGIGSAAASANASEGAHGLMEIARTAYSDAAQVAFWVAAIMILLAAAGAVAKLGTVKAQQ